MARFSKWKELKIERIRKVPNEPGVYKIRCKHKQIGRLIGRDDDGILNIGESDKLRRRLRTFLRCANDPKKAGHAAGCRYARLNLGKKGLPVGELEFRWKRIDVKEPNDKKETYREEGKLLKAYVDRFGELPPLNCKDNRSAYKD